MSRLQQFQSSVNRLVRDRQGAVGVLFGVMLLPLIAGVGVSIDFARMVQAKADLQNVVDQAALAGATVFVDKTAGPTATTAATNYFNSALLLSSITPSLPSVVTNTSGITNFGTTAFTVKVSATATLKSSLLTMWTSSLKVAAAGTAGNPQVNPIFKATQIRSNACDSNTIYLYQVPIVGGTPSYTTVPTFTTGATGNYWEIGNNTGAALPAGQPTAPPGITTNVVLGIALQNKVNANPGKTGCGITVDGANSYGAPNGAVDWFYSSLMPAGYPPSYLANYNYNAAVTESGTPLGISKVTTTIQPPLPPTASGSVVTQPTPSGTSCSTKPCSLVQYTGGASTATGGTTACKTTSLKSGLVTLNCATQYPTGTGVADDLSLFIQEGSSVTAAYITGLSSTSTPPSGTGVTCSPGGWTNGDKCYTNTEPWSKFGAFTCAGLSQLSANSAVFWWNDGGGESPGADYSGGTANYNPGAGDDHDFNDAFFAITCTLAVGGSGSGSTEVVLID